MKKVLCLVLTLAMVLAMSVTAFAAEDENKDFNVCTADGYHITAAVLVENGKAYPLTENEYATLMVNGKPHTWSKKSAALAGGEY